MNHRQAAAGVLVCLAAVTLAACSAGSATTSSSTPTAPFGWFAAGPAPAGWSQVDLPDHTATMSFPSTSKPVHADTGTVAYATVQADGQYLMYLNATPRQSTESLADWAHFRIDHLSDENTAVALDAAATQLPFAGGSGSCVLDHYTTRIGAHRYREIACFVQGAHGGSVLVAATSEAFWSSERPALEQAVDSYVAR